MMGTVGAFIARDENHEMSKRRGIKRQVCQSGVCGKGPGMKSRNAGDKIIHKYESEFRKMKIKDGSKMGKK